MANFVLYRRVSTEEQGKSGLGLEAQTRDMRLYLDKLEDANVVAEFTDIISGKSEERPELTKAVGAALASGASLLVAKLDRLSRRVSVISALMEVKGLAIKVAAMPDAENFQLHIYAALAEQERRFISERTKAALAAAKARGQKLGGARPQTVKANGDRAKQAVKRAEKMRSIIEPIWRHTGRLDRTADALNKASYPAANGGAWTPTQIRRVLIRLGLKSH